MKIGFAQLNPTVGDLNGNFELIMRAYERLSAAGAEVVLTPELAVPDIRPKTSFSNRALCRKISRRWIACTRTLGGCRC